MNLKKLRERDAHLRAEIARVTKERAAIGDAVLARPEGERKMTEEERQKFLSLGETVTNLKAEQEENAELLQAAVVANEAERAEAQRAAAAESADTETVRAAAGAAGVRVEMGEDLRTQAPGYFGAQLHAVRKAALLNKGGEPLTERDRELLRPMSAATGANTDVPPEGGFLVGQQRASGLIQRAYETGVILSRVTRMPIGAGFNGAKLPAIDETSRADNSRFGGIVSGWLGQGNTLSSGKPKFREIDLKLRKVGAFVYSTDEMNVDSVLFEAWVNRYLPLELQFRTEDAIINGDGANKPQGIFGSPAIINVTRATTGRVKSDDMRGMWNRMWAPLRSTAVWLIDQSVEPDLDQLSFAIGTAGVLDPDYKSAGSVPGQPYATYKGRPIIPVEYMAALGTTGDITLVSLPEYILIDKGGVQADVSLHVAFLTDEAVYRFMYRVDGQLPWNAALTPKSGGSTLTCVVRLTT